MDDDTGFGFGHLAGLPVTLTFGMVLLIVVAILVFLRIAFGEIRVSGGARA